MNEYSERDYEIVKTSSRLQTMQVMNSIVHYQRWLQRDGLHEYADVIDDLLVYLKQHYGVTREEVSEHNMRTTRVFKWLQDNGY